jgi:biopolymer transport protein ExbD
MVDVIMVLLVFFMLGATIKLHTEGVLASELDPRSGPSEGTPISLVPAVKIALIGGGDSCSIYVAGQLLPDGSFESLRTLLAQRLADGADPRGPVVIAAQDAVPWKFVVAAMDAAVRAGFSNVQFAVSLRVPAAAPRGGPGAP